jgi:hypothetical protein
VVEAGQTASLDIDLQVTAGPRQARITVETNDPEGPKSMVITWHGKARLTLIPRNINDKRVQGIGPYERTVLLVYPGGKTALRPQMTACECDSDLVNLRAGRDDPEATRFARSGILTHVQGEQEFLVTVRPPHAPGPFITQCRLHLKYGNDALTLVLPISLYFRGGELPTDFDTVLFAAPSAAEIKGQERILRVKDSKLGEQLIVQHLPRWLEAQVIQAPGKEAVIRMKIIASPPGPSVQHLLSIARRKDRSSVTPVRVEVYAPTPQPGFPVSPAH